MLHCSKNFEFLQDLLELSRSGSTLKVYMATLKAHHSEVEGVLLGCH